MANEIYYRGTKREAKAAIRRIVGMATGRVPDVIGVQRGMALAVGVAALSDIKDDFVKKADGQTGEFGGPWRELSPEYLAYQRRFGKGEKTALKKAAGIGRGNHYAPGGKNGLLSFSELKLWKKIYFQMVQRFLLSYPVAEAKAFAAQVAWAQLKREGAQTKLNVFGHRKVQILRDTGRLLNSLSPGELTGEVMNANYTKPSGEGGANQIMELLTRGVIVGTNVVYASRQNAMRPFIPTEGNVPTVWWNRWAIVANQALFAGIRFGLQVGM